MKRRIGRMVRAELANYTACQEMVTPPRMRRMQAKVRIYARKLRINAFL
jgi:hypothetical protein